MTDNKELQARIAALAGKINQQKQIQHQPSTESPPLFKNNPQRALDSRHPRGRWSPYGRGGRGTYLQPHKNRTLVLGGKQTPPRAARNPDAEALANDDISAESFVSAQAPGRKVLMNHDTYQREQKQALENKKNARTAKKQKIDLEERRTLIEHVNSFPASNQRELVVDGVRFQLREDGSKLMRIPGEPNSTRYASTEEKRLNNTDANTAIKETRKKVTIAGIDFHRTKNGNLVRANAVRDLLRSANNKKKPQCEHFTKHGKCPFGPACKFSHDPDKVAICKTFLRNGMCEEGDSCDFSHVTSYHRVPACTHFQRNNCTKEACPYPHIHVSPSAHVCRPFAFLGYCDDGEECTKRHAFECPDYSNDGFCANRENGKCPLPHTDRASALRKAAAKQARTGSEDESDLSSEEENQHDDTGIDDIDSDEAEDIITSGMDDDHALSQQQDFIAFS